MLFVLVGKVKSLANDRIVFFTMYSNDKLLIVIICVFSVTLCLFARNFFRFYYLLYFGMSSSLFLLSCRFNGMLLNSYILNTKVML